MRQRWHLAEVDRGARDELSRALCVSPLVATVLVSRGYADVEAARSFLAPSLGSLPDPEQISGMTAAVDRLALAAASGEVVWVYTDYDVDGVTSAVVLREFLEACGITCRVRLPRRDQEGYGLTLEVVREVASSGGSLLVTADCGIGAIEPARLARELGLEVIVTDHHTPGETLPDAVAVVNPKLEPRAYPDQTIAGVGVAWNLAAALRRRLRVSGWFDGERPEPDVRRQLDLVALGTVADVVPLRDVNRVLVSAGLQVLNAGARPGVEALKAVAGVTSELRAGHIGFQLGPRLNAAGRMDGPQEAVEVLSTSDRAVAAQLARRLDELNRERQEEERRILQAAVGAVESAGWMPERWSLVAQGEGWHPGVIGIVASRFVERFHRPTVILSVTGGVAKGSARSIRGLNLVEALGDCSDLLDRFGGHAAAAGLELGAGRVDAFRERFEEAVRARLAETDLVPMVFLDGDVSLGDLQADSVRQLAGLEPFGMGNPSPVFLTAGARLRDVRRIGREGQHLRLRFAVGRDSADGVVWRAGPEWDEWQVGMVVDMAHVPKLNTWNGIERVQLEVVGLRRSERA